MTEARHGNYQSCCRLCLCDKVDSLKSVFDDATADGSLSLMISTVVAIEITSADKITTMICRDCTTKINSFHRFKEECSENQTKLEQWHLFQINEAADMSIQIKEEPVGDDDDMVQITHADENGRVKAEPSEAEVIDEDFDYPPPLTPYPPPDKSMDGTEDEDSQISANSSTSKESSRNCSICDKAFSSVGNRKRHERDIHPKTRMDNRISIVPTIEEKSQNSVDSQPASSQVQVEIDDEMQKIQFAAGLKLLQTNETPIAFEALSKIELSYIEKCKAMVNMYKSFICACHDVQHPNLKGLLSHLRSIRVWFPVFTCYSCMITFCDRSSFTRHSMRCHIPTTDALIKLSHLRKRSEVKTRLYQNFRCTICKFMFSFHEEFCKHVNEEHVVAEEAPFVCTCTRSFTNVEDYKDHIYVSCLVEFFCDVCFTSVKSLEAFKKHASEAHDNSEGFELLQQDNYRMRKSITAPKPVTPEDPPILHTKRRSSFYNRKTVYEQPEVEEEKPVPFRVPNPASKKKPTACPICGKMYSTYANMVRHYRSHTKGEIARYESSKQTKNQSFYSCPDCGGMYDSEKWQQHLTEKHESVTCSECGKVFQFQSELDQHRSVHLNLKVYRDSKTQAYKSTKLSPNSEEAMLLCVTCDISFETEEEFREHKATHGEELASEVDDNGFRCKICDLGFPGYNALWEHNRLNHPNVRTPQSKDFPKQCKFCDKLLYTGGSYFMHKQMHEKIIHTSGLIKEERDAKPTNVKMIKSKRLMDADNDEDDEDSSYHTCRKCFKVFSSKCNLTKHMESHGVNMSIVSRSSSKKVTKKMWCNICHVSFDSANLLEQHKQEEHGLEDMPTLVNQTDSVDIKGVIFTCDICVMTFTSRTALKKHKERHIYDLKQPTKTSIYCKYCKIGFDNVAALNKHMTLEHNKNKNSDGTFACSVCKKKFQTAMARHAHMGWHKRDKTTLSGKPGKVLKQNKIVTKMARAMMKPPVIVKPEFQCTTCLAELPNDTALQIHILEKHRNVNAIMLIPRCTTCNLDFKSQEEYDTHKRFHDFLERQQQQTALLSPSKAKIPKMSPVTITKQPQQKTRNFPCNYCKATFSKLETLTTHVRQFHKDASGGEFKCTQCDRVFDKQNSLSIHLKVHEKQRSTNNVGAKAMYSCSICNMGFELPKDLRTHTINAHPF